LYHEIGFLVTLDGSHRLKKAFDLGIEYLPAKLISEEELNSLN